MTVSEMIIELKTIEDEGLGYMPIEVQTFDDERFYIGEVVLGFESAWLIKDKI